MKPWDDMTLFSGLREIRQAACMRGFNLVELMVTLAMMAILVSLAAPSLGQLVASNRVSSKVNDFVGALNTARSEAVRRGSAITMCKSSDGAACNTGSGTDWAVGWIICDDPDPATTCTGRPILRVHSAIEGAKAIAVTTGMTPRLTFLPIGRPPANYVGGEIQVCPADTKYAGYGRKIVINTQGRPQISSLTC